MATLPYMQLYVADYLADTMHLTAEEHGAYLLLIMNYWQTEKPIPENRLQGITRMFNDRWTTVKSSLSDFFKIDENGCWYHERVEKDLEKIKLKSQQASEAGRKSAQKRAKEKPLNAEEVNDRSTTVQRKVNDRSTIEDKDKDKYNNKKLPTKKPKDFLYESDFEQLWKIYNVGDKWAAYKSWHFRKKDYTGEELIKALRFEDTKQFGKRHFSTVLNSDLDEILKATPIKKPHPYESGLS